MTNYKKMDSYEGIKIKQSNHILESFPELFKRGQFSRVIEVGVFAGGLSLYISKIAPEVEYLGYDIDRKPLHLKAAHLNIKFMDFMADSNNIKEYIARNGRCLILCDGGNKLFEFTTISPWLKVNDVIMTHDYLNDLKHDISLYRSVKGFMNPETTKTMLEPIAKRNGLTDNSDIDFTYSLWSHWTKK